MARKAYVHLFSGEFALFYLSLCLRCPRLPSPALGLVCWWAFFQKWSGFTKDPRMNDILVACIPVRDNNITYAGQMIFGQIIYR